MDKKLYNSMSKLVNIGDALNIYFTYKKIKKGCYIDIDSTKSYKFENILDKYKLKYKKYEDEKNSHYFICYNPQNIDFFGKYHIKLGKFLGYGCVHDIIKDEPCVKGYLLQIVYNDNQVYGFCCTKLTINVINKMNYYIRKYLSDKLKGYIELSIVKMKNMR